MKVSKKKARKGTPLDCTGKGICEKSNDCEVGEICGDLSSGETQCYLAKCDEVEGFKVAHHHAHHVPTETAP